MSTITALATLSTHILDTSLGKPVADVKVVLEQADGKELGSGVTDADGRVKSLGGLLLPGVYRLRYFVAEHFEATKRHAFYDSIPVEFRIDGAAHYHVPLLINPYGYSTYRGS
jgi:5-hydroxyisourate hydrolase